MFDRFHRTANMKHIIGLKWRIQMTPIKWFSDDAVIESLLCAHFKDLMNDLGIWNLKTCL